MIVDGQSEVSILKSAPLQMAILFANQGMIIWLAANHLLPPVLRQRERRLSREGYEAGELKLPRWRVWWHRFSGSFHLTHRVAPLERQKKTTFHLIRH